MADSQTTALSVFSGIGGLDLGWELVTAGRVVGYCERDAYAANCLLERMEDAALEPAPVWAGDVGELDLAAFHGVGWVIGGFPCQDISVAGRGVGIDGERSGLWSELLRAYRDSGARYLFAENVSAITFRGLDRVLHDLAEIGCAAEWLCLRASDVGAPHRRERCFILAHRVPDAECGATLADGHGHGRESERSGSVQHRERAPQRHDADGCEQGVADASSTQCSGCGERRPGRHFPSSGPGPLGQVVGDARGPRLPSPELSGQPGAACGGPGERRAAARESDRALFPPGPRGGWSDIEPHLQPAIEPGLRWVVDGASLVVDEARADQLRCLGNGVVPLQAAVALRELLRRIKEP